MNEVATDDSDRSGIAHLKSERGRLTSVYARGIWCELNYFGGRIINDNCRFSRDSAASGAFGVSAISCVVRRGDAEV